MASAPQVLVDAIQSRVSNMSDELIKRLENRINRRSFLKGSALLAVSAFAIPASLAAQDVQNTPNGQDGRERQEGQDTKGRDGQDKDKQGQDGQKGQEGQDKTAAPPQQAKEGDGAETFVGSDGRPYRVCPQCGSNMYKQGRTWTCENCGYSYEE